MLLGNAARSESQTSLPSASTSIASVHSRREEVTCAKFKSSVYNITDRFLRRLIVGASIWRPMVNDFVGVNFKMSIAVASFFWLAKCCNAAQNAVISDMAAVTTASCESHLVLHASASFRPSVFNLFCTSTSLALLRGDMAKYFQSWMSLLSNSRKNRQSYRQNFDSVGAGPQARPTCFEMSRPYSFATFCQYVNRFAAVAPAASSRRMSRNLVTTLPPLT